MGALMLAVLDGVLSSLITCHPVGTESGHGSYGQTNKECTALAGPLFLSFLGIVDFTDNHGEAITALFTIARVPSGTRLEFGDAISGNMRLSFQAARSIG
jgi:hypothetical protein